MAARKTMTTSSGNPVDDNRNSLTAGPRGPILLQDFTLIDKLAHFDRERIPERVVHAKGAGAHGYFEVSHDITKYCKAKVFESVGKRTPLFTRFSTVGGEKGSADSERDPRGFAVKFYTEEGNWDLVGNNTPIFFIRDPINFADFLHTQKRNPANNLKDPNAFWDFMANVPETIHQTSFLFSNRGTPYSYRFMNGYGSHTFKMVNAEGQVHFVKFHLKCDQGIKNFSASEADSMKSSDADWATRDLFDHLATGQTASWTMYIQALTPEEAESYRYDILDLTKVVPQSDFPLIPVGKMVLNRNPSNYFAETEQSAFSPSHMVPGIEPSNCKMLQGRLFSYPDTHRHRLGANYDQIPINCPYRARANVYSRDGPMCVNGNNGPDPNYYPNSYDTTPEVRPDAAISPFTTSGDVGRYAYSHPNDDYEQCGVFFRKVLNDSERDDLINNISGHLANARRDIQERMIPVFTKVDPEYGRRVAEKIGLNANVSKL